MESWARELINNFYQRVFSERFQFFVKVYCTAYLLLVVLLGVYFLVFSFLLFIFFHQAVRVWYVKQLTRKVNEGVEYFCHTLKARTEREALKSLFNLMEKYSGNTDSRVARHLKEEVEALSLDFSEIARWGFITDLKRHLGKPRARITRI